MKVRVPFADRPRIVKRYLVGETQGAIAKSYGVTSERIRQILAAEGYSGRDAPRWEALRSKRAAHKARRRQSYMRGLRITRGEYEDWKARVPDHRKVYELYRNLKRNCALRGIRNEFTLLTWWGMWMASGLWDRRRVYCMSRLDTTGPYSVSNIQIIPLAEMARETRLRTLAKQTRRAA